MHDCKFISLGCFTAYEVGCVLPTVFVSILSHAEFGRNDHGEDASHFINDVFSPYVRRSKLYRKPS